MRRAVLGALSLVVLLACVRVLGRILETRLDLSGAPPAEVAAALRERLARLDSDLLLTYAVSSEASMPRELRGVADEVLPLLRSIEREGGGRVRVQVLDPDVDPALPVHLAGMGLAPFRTSALEMDAPVERNVWSGLRIAYGAHGAACVRAVTPEILPGLQRLLLAHLDLLERPRRARVALSAPAEFVGLRRSLRERAELLECDFEADAGIPPEADLFLWIDPGIAEARHLDAVRALLDRGGSAVVAGSATRASFVGPDEVRFERTAFPRNLWRELGLVPVEGLAVDPETKGPSSLVRSIGANQDFRSFSTQPNGTLLFASPTAFEPDASRLAELGFGMTTLASSSASTRLSPFAEGPIQESRLRDPESAPAAPRLPLLVLLSPDRGVDPWRGSLVVAAASTPFRDEYLRQESLAHEALLSVLVGSLASPERIAIQAAGVPGPPRIRQLSPAGRNLWRAALALAAPALLAILFLSRSQRAPRLPLARMLAATPALLGILLVAGFAPDGLAIDLTRDGLNRLAAETRAIVARRVSCDAPVHLELVLSPGPDLPDELRTGARTLRETLRRLASSSSWTELSRVRTAGLGAEDLAALARDGVLPLPSGGRNPAFASVVLRGGGRRETLAFPDPSSFEHVEFRLASAIERLFGARKARVAVAASAPALSAAEELEFRKRGLFAPGGSDVFGAARGLLEANDFAVSGIDAAEPRLAGEIDLLLCLQPRRDAGPLVALAARMLARGGSVLLAGQHFGVRSRRTLASGMQLALWPEPQYDDLDRLYFPKVGIELVREVLLDDLHGSADVATQVERETGRFEEIRERAVNPLFVRAVPDGFDRSSPYLRGISELCLPSPNRLRWDDERLLREGLSARALVSTSDRARSLAWKGGDLPTGEGGTAPIGRVPLAALFEGRFPPPSIDPALPEGAEPGPNGQTGRLLFVGCSAMFRDGELAARGGDNAQFLLNCAAGLTLPPDLAAVLARRSAPPSLGIVDPSWRILWRILILGAGPAAVLLLGWTLARRRNA